MITDASLEEFEKQTGPIKDMSEFKRHLQQYLGAVPTQLHVGREKSYSMLAKTNAAAVQEGLKISKSLVTVVTLPSHEKYINKRASQWPESSEQKQQQSIQNNTLMGSRK